MCEIPMELEVMHVVMIELDLKFGNSSLFEENFGNNLTYP